MRCTAAATLFLFSIANSFARLRDTNTSIPRSILRWDPIDKQNSVSIISMVMGHHADSSWFLPSLHGDGSEGRNTSGSKHTPLGDSFACYIKFYGVGMEANVRGFEFGGLVALKISYRQPGGRMQNAGHDDKVVCYYTTSYNLGSDFVDSPKLYGLAIYCPLSLDQEIGRFDAKKRINQGRICRPLADYDVSIALEFSRSTAGVMGPPIPGPPNLVLRASFLSAAAAPRALKLKEISRFSKPHAVCTVQTFRNVQTGPMLYLFAAYYLKLGWRVIIYDRLGMHSAFLKELESHPGLDYHRYTVLQLLLPDVYNEQYLSAQTFEDKYFYRKEGKHGYGGMQADTANQDHDKSRTYDLCRIEYAHLDLILYVDSDELFYCPLPPTETHVRAQRRHQQRLMATFVSRGVDEMRFVRLPYSGLAHTGMQEDLTNATRRCMLLQYETRDLRKMLSCWSSASSYDHYAKSADLGSVCPFHYNHWSCDGQQWGGRDKLLYMRQCRCKVDMEMFNGYTNEPKPERCHLMHLNDKKFSFEAANRKKEALRGNKFQPNPAAAMLGLGTSFDRM